MALATRLFGLVFFCCGLSSCQQHSSVASAHYFAAHNYFMVCDVVHAERQYRLDLQEDHRNALSFYGLGDVYRFKGSDRVALRYYDTALTLNSKFVFAYVGRGSSYSNLGLYHYAIADFTQAVRLKPDWYIPYYCRGVVKEHKGDFGGAIADFNRVISIAPDLVAAYHARSGCYSSRGQYQAALQDIDSFLVNFVEDQSAFLERALLELRLKDTCKACQDFIFLCTDKDSSGCKYYRTYCNR